MTQLQIDKKPELQIPKIPDLEPKLKLEITSAIRTFDSAKVNKFFESDRKKIIPLIKAELNTIPIASCPLEDIYNHFAYFKFLIENDEKLKIDLPKNLNENVASSLAANKDLSKQSDKELIEHRQRLVNISYYSILAKSGIDLKNDIQLADDELKKRFVDQSRVFNDLLSLSSFISRLEQLNFSYSISESNEEKAKANLYKNKIQEIVAGNTPTVEQISNMSVTDLEKNTLNLVYFFLKYSNQKHSDLLKIIDLRVKNIPLKDLENQINTRLEEYPFYSRINEKNIFHSQTSPIDKEELEKIGSFPDSISLRIFPEKFDPKLHQQVFSSMIITAFLEHKNKIKSPDEIIFANPQNVLEKMEAVISKKSEEMRAKALAEVKVTEEKSKAEVDKERNAINMKIIPTAVFLVLNQNEKIDNFFLKTKDLLNLSAKYKLFVLDTLKAEVK